METEAGLKWLSMLFSRLPIVHTQLFNGLLFMKLLSRLTLSEGADEDSLKRGILIHGLQAPSDLE